MSGSSFAPLFILFSCKGVKSIQKIGKNSFDMPYLFSILRALSMKNLMFFDLVNSFA